MHVSTVVYTIQTAGFYGSPRPPHRSFGSELGSKETHRAVERIDGAYALREESDAHDAGLGIESAPLRLENTISWDENAETAQT